MFSEGSAELNLDERGRFPIPSKIRRAVGEGDKNWVFAINPNNFAVLFPKNVWGKRLSEADDKEDFRLRWHPYECQIDSQGRIIMPPEIKKLAGIGQKGIIVYMGEYLLIRNIQEKNSELLEELVGKFPDFNLDWPVEKKTAWMAAFSKICNLLS
jgi:MraZ protein